MQNIFKSSHKQDNTFINFFEKKNYLKFLNTQYNDIIYEHAKSGTIKKNFFNKKKFDIELYTILTLENMNLDIFPKPLDINYQKSIEQDNFHAYIIFDTKEMVPLRKVLETFGTKFHLLINELLSFLQYLKLKNIVIGNLHIDSIYINLKTMHFYILDLKCVILLDSKNTNINLQSLYISLCETDINPSIIKYVDNEIQQFNKNLSKYSYTNSLLELYNH
jgi:hypothetical protein